MSIELVRRKLSNGTISVQCAATAKLDSNGSPRPMRAVHVQGSLDALVTWMSSSRIVTLIGNPCGASRVTAVSGQRREISGAKSAWAAPTVTTRAISRIYAVVTRGPGRMRGRFAQPDLTKYLTT